MLAERERWALWLPVALGIGIGVYFALPNEPTPATGAAIGVAGLCAGTLAGFSRGHFIRALLAATCAALIGFGVAKWRTESVAAPVLMHRVGPVEIEGRVEWAQQHGKGVRVLLSPTQIDFLGRARMPAHVRITVRSGGARIEPGAVIRAYAVLLPPPPPASPGDYDFGRAAYFDAIGAVGYAFGAPQIVVLAGAPNLFVPAGAPNIFARLSVPVEALRWRMAERIHRVLPGSTGAIAAALIAGDRGGIAEADEEALRDAGLAHVLAIAGLHMGLVGLGLFWAVRACLALIPSLALTQPIKKWAAVAALAGAGFYLAISGATEPATRAFVMLAAMLLAVIVDRPALSMRSLGFAAAVILFMRPEGLLEPGFQMSFAAVGSLIAVAEWEQKRVRRGQEQAASPILLRARRYLRGIMATSLVGSIATMPYAAFHFDRATHYAVLGNLLAMPIMGLITMPAAAFAVVLMPLKLDVWPLYAMGWGINAMLAVGRFVSHLPGAISSIPAWPLSALVLVSLAGLWIVIWRGKLRWLGSIGMAAAALLTVFSRPPDLLIARDGITVAVRMADGRLVLVRHPANSYSASQWLKRDGDTRAPDQAVAGPKDNIRCDAFGCVAIVGTGKRIAITLRPDGLGEDCAAADIVVSAVPVRSSCRGPKLVIDRAGISHNGAYAVWFGSPFRLATVQGVRGDRPWSREPWAKRFRVSLNSHFAAK